MNNNNEIWHLVYDENEKQISRLTKDIKPFTVQDFDKYFDNIFSNKFLNTVTKLKLDDLNKKMRYKLLR